MDKTGANFERAVASIHSRLGVKAVPLQFPLGAESDFSALIDLVEMRLVRFDGEPHENYKVEPIPPE